jgi:GT2 family glycosyltransferase
MGSEVSVSVVMAAHNSEETIRQAIASVRLQSREDWELIVIDDGSGDDTVAVASSIADERIQVVSQENQGPAAARNAGIRLARAPLVSTLDSDDLWLPQYLETMLGVLDNDRDAALAYTDAWVLDHATGRIRKTTEMAYQRAPQPPPASPRDFLKELLRTNFVYNSVTARRDALLAVGGYDERLWTSEDWELWLRIAASGRRCVRAPGILAVHRDHAGSLSTDGKRMKASRSEVYRMVERDWDIDDEIRSFASVCRWEFERPRVRDALPVSLQRGLRSVRAAIQRRTLWHRRAPGEVTQLLAASHRSLTQVDRESADALTHTRVRD